MTPTGRRKLTTAELIEALPEARELLGEDAYRWSSEANHNAVANEIESARLAESMGYIHRVEMHLSRALEILRADASRG